jgi:hypothetical protein
MTTSLSFDGQPLAVGDRVFMMKTAIDQSVELTAVRITQLVEGSSTAKIAYLEDGMVREGHSPTAQVCKDPIFLITDWENKTKKIMEEILPDRLVELGKMKESVMAGNVPEAPQVYEGLTEEDEL